jgi:Ca2+-binding EF-hand superfamily protein|tara:strand:+ start:4495 stop:4881 length:387 start_codon:yes stop_codon:yes gene_type:complete
MKIKLFAVIAVLAGLAVASGTPEKEEGRKDRGKPGIKQWIEKFDKNGDGKLDEAERKAAGAARKAEFLKKFDKDGDGKISAEERKAIAEAMKRRRGGPKPEGKRQRPDGKGKGKGKGPKKGKGPAKKK